MVRFVLLSMVRLRAMTITAAMTAGCLLPEDVGFNNERPVTPPIILDLPGVTSPRLGGIVQVRLTAENPFPSVDFRVPFTDMGVNDLTDYRFFINQERGLCTAPDGGTRCQPAAEGTIRPDDNLSIQRELVRTVSNFPGPTTGARCYRVDLFLSERFTDYQRPRREGDLAMATWWVIARRDTDPAVGLESCPPP